MGRERDQHEASPPATPEAIHEEQKRLRRLRFLVDLTTSVLYQDTELSLAEARELVEQTKEAILTMFPDKQETYDLLLRPRFDRIIAERWFYASDSDLPVN